MSIHNVGTYYSNLITPRVPQVVFVTPNPVVSGALGTGATAGAPQVVPMAGVFSAGSIISNIQLCGANPNSATFMVGLAGVNASLTGNLYVLGTGSGNFPLPGATGYATGVALGITLAQDSWLTASFATGAGTLAASNLNLAVVYIS